MAAIEYIQNTYTWWTNERIHKRLFLIATVVFSRTRSRWILKIWRRKWCDRTCSQIILCPVRMLGIAMWQHILYATRGGKKYPTLLTVTYVIFYSARWLKIKTHAEHDFLLKFLRFVCLTKHTELNGIAWNDAGWKWESAIVFIRIVGKQLWNVKVMQLYSYGDVCEYVVEPKIVRTKIYRMNAAHRPCRPPPLNF